ncbi:MAG: flap endonuclease-1 [Candidatus Marsarchaeota archaeon]|nr:flap endonuclease-1 [Candidatus Marsarchaeota archaeon]
MAVDLSKLVWKRKLSFEELNNKTIAIDAYNILYQFLSIIRQQDGSPLTDSHGKVTSHLSGLLYRNTELISYGAKLVYVFDGIPSMLKQKTIEARMQRKKEAYEAWQKALERGAIEEAKQYAQGTVHMTKEIVESAKQLLDYMGIPHINAPSEGEAQASSMCKQGIVFAVGSQDYDTMLFGAPHVVRNMTISGKRKLPRKNIYVNVEPEIMDFKETVNALGVNQRQLIWIGMMLGTDYNEGVKGVGPKTALKIAKQSKSLEDVVSYLKEKYDFEFEIAPKDIEEMFLNPEVKEMDSGDADLMFKRYPNKEKLVSFMCDEHDFGRERVERAAERLLSLTSAKRQSGISSWV